MLMPRGGRPLVSASVTPAACRSRDAAIACSVSTLSCVTSVPSTSASSSFICFALMTRNPSFQMTGYAKRSGWLDDGDLEVNAFPAVLLRPEHGEADDALAAQAAVRQIEDIDAEAGRDRRAVENSIPVVGRPVHPHGLQKFQPQDPARRDAVDLRGLPPDDRRRRRRV